LKGFVSNTDFAQHIAGAVSPYRRAFLRPTNYAGEEELALELPRDQHLSRRGITSARQLAEAAIAHGMTPAWHNSLTHEISSCYFIPDEFFGAAWALAIPLHPKLKRR